MGLSVQTILSIALAVIFVIAASLVIQLIFPHSTQKDCMKGQRLNIEEIESMVKDAKLKGITYTLKFKVENCVECMWYYKDNEQLKIRWIGMSATEKPAEIGVSVDWNIGDNNGETDYCTDESLKGGTICVFEVNYNAVDINQC